MFQIRWTHIAVLAALPLLVVLIRGLGPIQSDTLYTMSGFGYDVAPQWLPGRATLDPDTDMISTALGKRGALELLSGRLPLWNHYEGLGGPLLGNVPAAALFPANLLLALPHGQGLEHALLQLTGGLGAFLFFRRFGLTALAALSGALMFEVNGIFAWLHSGIFNFVALLPWLFLCIENLWIHAAQAGPFRLRIGEIAVGALAAGLTPYTGFPQGYFYAVPVLAWAVYRFMGLAPATRPRFALDLGLTALLAGALAAPAVAAVLYFMPDAAGGHDATFSYFGLHAAAWLRELAPYIYGLIGDTNNPSAWNAAGGYFGFAPVLAGAAALGLKEGRGVKAALLALIIVALLLPFANLTGCTVFASIFLAVMFIDRIPALPRDVLRRVGATAAGAGLVIAAGSVAAGWPLVRELWAGTQHQGVLIGSFGIMGALDVTFLAAAYLPPHMAARTVAAALVMEAAVLFFVPFLSYPRAVNLDTGAITFLQQNVGYGRVTGFGGHGIGPNAGAAFGIPNLNHNDPQVPRLTTEYLRRTLDPEAGQAVLGPAPGEAQRLAAFRAKLPDYAKAGIKYVLADANFNIRNPVNIPPGLPGRDLAVGEVVEAEFTAADPTLAGLTVIMTNKAREAVGRLKTTACAVNRCVAAETPVTAARNGRPLLFAFPDMLPVSVGEAVTVLIERLDGTGRIAVAVRETNGAAGPVLGVIPLHNQLPVYAGPSMAIYELPGTRPYFSAPGCTLETRSWDEVKADCAAPATLTRLELALRGWSAKINGGDVTVGREDETFQTVQLPAGASDVTFRYWPPHFTQAIAAAFVALMFILGGLAVPRPRSARGLASLHGPVE